MFYIYKAQKRPNAEPQGTPEALDRSFRQQIEFRKIDFLHVIKNENGRMPSRKASQKFSMACSKFNFKKSIFTLVWNRTTNAEPQGVREILDESVR